MRKHLIVYLLLLVIISACGNNPQATSSGSNGDTDTTFNAFKLRFMDAYWKQNPSSAIGIGYGKYYDLLKIPDSAGLASDISFSKLYLDSLHSFGYGSLSDNNKIDYKILENQF